MPTTRSATRPSLKRDISPESNDDDDEFTFKKLASSQGRRKASTRGRGRRGGGIKSATIGKPPAKRGRKKKTNNSDSEDERANFDSDHLHEELKKCHSILIELAKEEHEAYIFPFKKPVDTIALGLLDYYEVIKKPMDLLTMKKKLIGEEYETAVEFKEDFKLIINNCFLYNNREDPVSQMALQLREVFSSKWKEFFSEDEDDFGKKDDNDDEEEGEDDDDGEQDKEEEKNEEDERNAKDSQWKNKEDGTEKAEVLKKTETDPEKQENEDEEHAAQQIEESTSETTSRNESLKSVSEQSDKSDNPSIKLPEEKNQSRDEIEADSTTGEASVF